MASGVGCAVFCKDVLFQTAAIHADADGNVLALTGIHHSLHPVIVADVAGVDADLIHAYICAGQSRLVVKMDVCHNGDVHRILTASMHFASAGLGQVTRRI